MNTTPTNSNPWSLNCANETFLAFGNSFYKQVCRNSLRKIQAQEVLPRSRSRLIEVRWNRTKRKRYCHASDFECRKAPARPLADGATSRIPHCRHARIPDVADARIRHMHTRVPFSPPVWGQDFSLSKQKIQKFYIPYFASNKLLKPSIKTGTSFLVEWWYWSYNSLMEKSDRTCVSDFLKSAFR